MEHPIVRLIVGIFIFGLGYVAGRNRWAEVLFESAWRLAHLPDGKRSTHFELKIPPAVSATQNRPRSEEVASRIEFYSRITGRSYDSAKGYTNLILALGYGTYFTLWTHLRPELKSWFFDFSGLLMIISLAVFIAAEINQMANNTFFNAKLMKELHNAYGGDVRSIDAMYSRNVDLLNSRVAARWLVLLWLTAGPAAIAVAISGSIFIAHLFKGGLGR